jgi:hypothetical protein
MMKRFALALLALAVTALPGFAADDSAPHHGAPGMHAPGMKPMMPPDPEMKRHMMRNPQHLMAMAYHKNLVNFAMILKKVAQQGDTVPRDFARATVTEMRRSADQMEISHDAGVKSLPAELQAKHAEMAKKMEAHHAQMRSQLDELDKLVKGDRVDSRAVLQHLQLLLKECQGMCREAGACREAMPGPGMHGGMHGGCGDGQGKCAGQGGCMGKGMDCGCGHHQEMGGCGHHQKMGCGCGHATRGESMPGGPGMMQERQQMMARMKAQDAEIDKLVVRMNSAGGDQQQGIMADILTRMVKQRAEMAAYLEKMHGHQKRHDRDGAGMAPCMMGNMMGDQNGADESEDADLSEDGAYTPDDQDSGDDDADDSLNMQDMNMQGQ